MFNEKEIEALRGEVADLRELLKQSEERRNQQFTEMMLVLKELKDLAETEDPVARWENDGELDEHFEEVREFVVKEQRASASLLQRRFKLGYGRAACIMDQLEEEGVIAPSDGTNRPRKVLVEEE